MTLNSIFDMINKTIDSVREPVQTIPSFLLSTACIQRPGLSPMLITANIIRRQAEAGAPFGPAPDGTNNIAEAMERIRVEEIIKALKMDGRVQVGIPVGGIQIVATGANAGGPVVVTGYNINSPRADGIIS